jgi:deoxyribose-phosphate aldolase
MKEQPTVSELARLIDHAILHPTHTLRDTLAGAELGLKFGTASACIKPCFVRQTAERLAGSGVAACAVVGFPHGNGAVSIKVAETLQAVSDGAAEIDVVVNNGLVAADDWDGVAEEIRAVQSACAEGAAILKVIFETDYLADERIVRLCDICGQTGVAYVKTSTGFGYVKQPDGDFNCRGATEHHIRLMREHCGPGLKIKASAGIRDLDDLLKFRDLGCDRVGTSATRAILEEAARRFWGGVSVGDATLSDPAGY